MPTDWISDRDDRPEAACSPGLPASNGLGKRGVGNAGISSIPMVGRRRPRLGRYAGVFLAGMISCSAVAAVVAAQNGPPAGTGGAGEVFQRQAASSGAGSCQRIIGRQGADLTRGAQFASALRADRSAPDRHLVSSRVGLTYDLPELKGQAAGILVAAPLASGCEGEMIRVAPLARSCDAIVATFPQGSVRVQSLSGVAVYELAGGRGEAMLLNNAAGCVVVSIAGARPDT